MSIVFGSEEAKAVVKRDQELRWIENVLAPVGDSLEEIDSFIVQAEYDAETIQQDIEANLEELALVNRRLAIYYMKRRNLVGHKGEG